MGKKPIYTLSYGVFVLGTKSQDKINACITNTCMQVASDPVRVAISVINNNYTCDLIKQSGVFALSILDKACTFETIKHFGMQSGRNVNKFENFEYSTDSNGCPYLKKQTCAVLSCKVVSSEDLGTHTLFIATIESDELLSDKESLTYDYYQNNIKPKPVVESQKKIVGWRCKICGYEYEGETLPPDYECPICGHPAEDFEPIYAS
jgi:flavin reductase (DIM6/NTAB) family NADH-FMN oxidoreductase RutF/rubredoxin